MSSFHQSKEWKATTTVWRPRFAADIAHGNVRCLNCPRLIHADEPWEIGHRISVANALDEGMTYLELCNPDLLWPAHRKCNRRDGQRIGIERTRVARATVGRLLPW